MWLSRAYVQILSFNLISSINWEVWHKVKIFSPDWSELGLIGDEWIRPKWGESMIFKNQKCYYIVLCINTTKLSLFLALIGEFNQKSNFQPRLTWIRPYKSQMGLNGKKTWFLRAGRDITYFLCITTANLTLFLINWEVWSKSKLSAPIGLNSTL